MHQKLHIVCFDNPFPASYGGVIDVFYKIKALHSAGVGITLHCFTSSADKAARELLAVTEAVHFYAKVRNPLYLFSSYPFATRSRSNKLLAERLLADDVPILFEGLQSAFLAFDPRFSDRRKFLRLHNLESNYYAGSSASERNLLKKLLFRLESKKFLQLEKQLSVFEKVLALSYFEFRNVEERFGNSFYLPVFHGNAIAGDLTALGKFALYHGDLRLADNLRAAEFMIEVFKEIPDYELIIASGAGGEHVGKLIKKYPHIRFIHTSHRYELGLLLQHAHINVMISFQESGTKLKLINSLHQSRHCLINVNITDDYRIRDLCVIASDVESYRKKIIKLRDTPYLDHVRRAITLDDVMNDDRNANSLRRLIFLAEPVTDRNNPIQNT